MSRALVCYYCAALQKVNMLLLESSMCRVKWMGELMGELMGQRVKVTSREITALPPLTHRHTGLRSFCLYCADSYEEGSEWGDDRTAVEDTNDVD